MSAVTWIPCPVAAWARSAPEQVALRMLADASGAGRPSLLTIDFAAWDVRIAHAEERLHAAGVGAGAHVGLCLPNSVELLTLLLAIFRTGAVACPVNPAFPAAYRAELLARLGCALVIGEDGLDAGRVGTENSLLATPPAPPPVGGALTAGAPDTGSYSPSVASEPLADTFPPACGSAGGGPAETDRELEGPNAISAPGRPTWSVDQPATIIFTSGSTGAPKAAVLSLRNHLESARLSNANIPLAPEDCWLLSLPLYHVAGFGVLFRCLCAGAAIAVPAPEAPLLDSMNSLGATHVSLVARQLAQLLEAASPPPPLKAILLGGSAMPAPLLDRAVAAGLPVHMSYGMTETASQIAATPPGASRSALGTSGRPLAADTVRIGRGGVIEVNGPARFLGYWESGALIRPFDEAGWFTTSDCGTLDDGGFLQVTGRKDNVFMAGGENIQPEEIERVLCELPGITQAVVVPVPHAAFGATPVAFVACSGALDAAAIREGLREALPSFKIPRHILPWPADLAAGMKVQRKELVERAAAVLADP